AKGAVAADGPQTPSRVQINKAMVGFLTHSGYSHGGNGFEGMAFLLEQFKDADLKDPTDRNHGLDLKAMATRFAEAYKEEKLQSKESGLDGPRALPGVHHPIFKGKPINYDPRERFIAEFMEKRGDYNIFHAFYRELVQALYGTGASRYVFCVNVDAVIAALLLAVLWKDYRSGGLTEKDLETAAFNVFLYGRMIGAAAEIDDHLNRGRNMDTRTPQEQCAFVVYPSAKTLVAVHHAGCRLVVVPARRAIVERQDGVTREICWNRIRGGIVGLHHLIVVGEDRLGNAVDEGVRGRSVGYDGIVQDHGLGIGPQPRKRS